MNLRLARIELGDVLVQVVAVALGVVLGLGATAWNERNHQRALLRETVGNIAAELRSNQAGMRRVIAEHAKSASALAAFAGKAGKSMLVSREQAKAILRPSRFSVNIPLAIAWQIAQNDQGLALLPYQDRYDLAWVYQVQTVYYDAERRYENSILTIAEPANGNYYLQIVDLANQEQAVVRIEHQLDSLYAAALRRAHSEFGVAAAGGGS